MSKNSQQTVLLLPGDGVGVELVGHAERILGLLEDQIPQLSVTRADIGGAAFDAHGEPLPPSTLAAIAAADAVLLGAVGGPQWDYLELDKRPEKALLRMRQEMGVFANLRPLLMSPALLDGSPLKPEIADQFDILIVRELTGGIYFGQPRGEVDNENNPRAFNTMIYSEEEVERIARLALDLAASRRQHLTSVDKANVLEVSRLWRRVVDRCAKDYPQVKVDHLYVDNAAMQLVLRPAQFDVMLTSNLFGDILSDLGAAVVGTIGVLPSASIGATGAGLFEAIHGSAPELVGKDCANPLATLYSLAMLFRLGLARADLADILESAIAKTLDDGLRTADMLTDSTRLASTSQMIGSICTYLK